MDTFSETENQLSFGGEKIENSSTVDGCKAACLKDEDCVGFDYDINLKECFAHEEDSFKFIHGAPGVNQYAREKCAEPVTTTQADITTTTSATTTTGLIRYLYIIQVVMYLSMYTCVR